MPEHDDLRSRVEALLRDHDPRTTPAAEFLGARFDAGLAWVHFPEGLGGLGLPRERQAEVERRLAAAHSRLLRASAADEVTEIATDLGFTHLGRFAIAYREIFGESPSQTLRRGRRVRHGGPIAQP